VKHDDQVDCMVYALRELQVSRRFTRGMLDVFAATAGAIGAGLPPPRRSQPAPAPAPAGSPARDPVIRHTCPRCTGLPDGAVAKLDKIGECPRCGTGVVGCRHYWVDGRCTRCDARG
jgi:hypothetical protein